MRAAIDDADVRYLRSKTIDRPTADQESIRRASGEKQERIRRASGENQERIRRGTYAETAVAMLWWLRCTVFYHADGIHAIKQSTL